MRDDQLRLSDIATSIEHIEGFVSGRMQDDLASDLQLRGAILHELSIIGEAAARLTEEFRSKHPEVDGRTYTDFRNEIVHEYLSLDLGIIWKTATKNLPKLKAQIAELLRTEFSR